MSGESFPALWEEVWWFVGCSFPPAALSQPVRMMCGILRLISALSLTDSHPSALCAATGPCTRQVSFSPDLAAPCVSQASDSGCGLGAPCVPFDLYLCFCMAWALSQQLSKPGCSCHHRHQALMCAEHGQAGAGIPFWECTQCLSPWELCGSPALPLGLCQLLSQGFPRK